MIVKYIFDQLLERKSGESNLYDNDSSSITSYIVI